MTERDQPKSTSKIIGFGPVERSRAVATENEAFLRTAIRAVAMASVVSAGIFLGGSIWRQGKIAERSEESK